MAAAAAAASGFLAFRVSCCDTKPRRGFGTQKDDKKVYHLLSDSK